VFELTIKAKDKGELQLAVAGLADIFGETTAPAKTLRDFPLQDIIEYAKANMAVPEVPEEPKAESPQPSRAKSAGPKAKKPEPETPETAEKEAPAPEASTPADPKDAAIKKVMAVYTDPKGKKLASDVLKLFGVKNFHLVPDDRGQELLDAVEKAIADAGLKV
jgi:hypothetical protein